MKMRRKAFELGEMEGARADRCVAQQHSLSRVAIVLRGQAFRDGRRYGRTCIQGAVAFRSQHDAWTSLLAMVIQPLEACGSVVDLFATECSRSQGCKLMDRFYGIFGARVVRLHTKCRSVTQADSMHHSLELFRENRPQPSQYGLILVTRHDMVWTTSIVDWVDADFSRFNFLAQCEKRCCCYRMSQYAWKFRRTWRDGYTNDTSSCSRYGGPPPLCVQDFVHAMPGVFFSFFYQIVASSVRNCFGRYVNVTSRTPELRLERQDGHQCYQHMARVLPKPPSFLITTWRPSQDSRERSPICHAVGAPLGNAKQVKQPQPY